MPTIGEMKRTCGYCQKYLATAELFTETLENLRLPKGGERGCFGEPHAGDAEGV